MSVTTDSPTEAQASTPPRLELHGAVDPRGHADAVIPVRWCVGPELVKTLQERGAYKPYLLLIVRPFSWIGKGERRRKQYHGESLRKLVPLTNELAYVSFSRPGNNEVRAVVVYNEDGGGALLELGPVFTAGDPFDYKTSIFDYDGDFERSHFERKSGKIKYTGVIAFYRDKDSGKEKSVTAGDQTKPIRLRRVYVNEKNARRAADREWKRMQQQAQ